MKLLPLFAGCAVLIATLGCGHVDLTPETDPNRVVTGTVNLHVNLLPPPDAQVVVRLVEPSSVTAAPTSPGHDVVIGERGPHESPAQVVAEQVIHAPATLPVPFRLEFRASDDVMRRGLNIEARISWGGRVRFRTVDSQVVTLPTAGQPNQPYTLWVEAVP